MPTLHGEVDASLVRTHLAVHVDADHAQHHVHDRLPRLLVLSVGEVVGNRREELPERLDEAFGIAGEQRLVRRCGDVGGTGIVGSHVHGRKVGQEGVFHFHVGEPKQIPPVYADLLEPLDGEIPRLEEKRDGLDLLWFVGGQVHVRHREV